MPAACLVFSHYVVVTLHFQDALLFAGHLLLIWKSPMNIMVIDIFHVSRETDGSRENRDIVTLHEPASRHTPLTDAAMKNNELENAGMVEGARTEP